MLHQDIKSPGPLELKNQARLHLCWKQSIKRVVCLSTQRCFNVIMDQSKMQANDKLYGGIELPTKIIGSSTKHRDYQARTWVNDGG